MLSLLHAAMIVAAPPQCASVDLALAEKQMPATFRGRPFRETGANFRSAYAKACAGGLMNSKPLAASRRLFLINAPEANVASIYSKEGRTVLEYAFVTPDKRVHVPTADELHEAIYCAIVGATPEEQERDGRCLVD